MHCLSALLTTNPVSRCGPAGDADRASMVAQRLLDEPEGARVPSSGLTAGPVVDAHVHVFPDRVMAAMYRWFDRHAWSIRYRLAAEEIVEHHRGRGHAAIATLVYSHAPGMAAELNRFAAEIGRAHRDFIWPLGTVLPGEPDAGAIAREALGPLGLRGLKVHCHVQKIAPDDPRMDDVYAACVDANKPLVMHAGRAPSNPAYGLDTSTICAVERVARVLQKFPKLRLVVPHLGADEVDGYAALLDRHENLWLDTTMMVADFFDGVDPWPMLRTRAHRLLYGSDFPILPYAWDRELSAMTSASNGLSNDLSADERRALFSGNATALFCSS